MANPIGAGNAIVMPLSSRHTREAQASVDEPSTIRTKETPSVAPGPLDPPEVLELLGRIMSQIDGKEEGLTAQELRLVLAERPERLQRALAAGLRARRIRRSGSRCQTRYLLNG